MNSLAGGGVRRRPAPQKLRPAAFLDPRRGWSILRWLQGAGSTDWRPEALFLGRETKVRVGSIDWTLFFEGYWEPRDPDRQGFEIGVAILLPNPVPLGTLKQTLEAGVLTRMDRELAALGFDAPSRRVPLTDSDLADRIRLGYLTFYHKNVLDPARYASESRRLLKWRPAIN